MNTVQGNQPLTDSYLITITSPANLIAGSTVNITLGTSVLSKPTTGMADAEALGFISVSPAALTFTGPGQQATFTVTVAVPLGNYAGDYAYRILPSGWPATLGVISDAGATVNARVSPPGAVDTTPPALTLLSPANGTVYTYAPATGIPVTVPVSFSASVGANGQAIDGLQAFINATPVSLTTTGLLSLSASASGSVQLTTPGTYTVSVMATNVNGTSQTSADISVVVEAPPPVITVSSPFGNSVFNFTLGGAGASVPVSFTASSIYGNITAVSATLNGSPVALNLSGVNSSTTASASAALLIPTPGTYNLVFSASNAYGDATPVTVPFAVQGVTPAPTVSILTPAGGAIFPRAAGDPATVVNYTFQGDTSYGAITSVSATLDGVPITPTVAGLNTAAVTGGGALGFSGGGIHTLAVTVANGGATASASTTFTVQQTQPQTCRDLTWLPPVSLNKTIEGGSTMPVKFTLGCDGKFVRDTTVLIAIYEVFADGSASDPVIYPYGAGSPNPPDYAIDGKKYQLNFKTAKGVHAYRIEVYSSASGSLQLLDSKDLHTKGRGRNDDHDDDHDGGDGHHGDD